MIFLEVIIWFGLVAFVGAYLLGATYVAKKFPNLRFFLGILITFGVPYLVLIACKNIITSNTFQAIIFFSLVVILYYINKCMAESADEELERERKLN